MTEYHRTFFAALAAAAVLPLAAYADMHTLDLSATDTANRVPPALAVGDRVSLSLPGGAKFDLAVDSETSSFGGARSFSARDAVGSAFATLVIDAAGGVQVEVRDIASNMLRRAALRGGRFFSEEIDLASVRRGGCIEVDADDEVDGPSSGLSQVSQDAESTRSKAGAVPGNPFDGNVVAPAPVMVDIMLVISFIASIRELILKTL